MFPWLTDAEWQLFSLPNPKKFWTWEPFRFSNTRFFVHINKNFRTRPSFVRWRRKICNTKTLSFQRLYYLSDQFLFKHKCWCTGTYLQSCFICDKQIYFAEILLIELLRSFWLVLQPLAMVWLKATAQQSTHYSTYSPRLHKTWFVIWEFSRADRIGIWQEWQHYLL